MCFNMRRGIQCRPLTLGYTQHPLYTRTIGNVSVAMSLYHFVAVLFLIVSAVHSQNNCLGPGFSQTIPSKEERFNYSTTVLNPGVAIIYSSLSFACNGTVLSLTVPLEVRASIYRYVSSRPISWVSVWRFNESKGYYSTVREFYTTVKLNDEFNDYLQLESDLQYTFSTKKPFKVRSSDVLGFRLRPSYFSTEANATVYQHMPFLFKPGPSPGAFTPIVSVNYAASSGPVSKINPEPRPSSTFCDCSTSSANVFSQKCTTEPIPKSRPSSTLCDCSTSSANVFSQKCIHGNTEVVADPEMNTTKGLITAPQASVQAMDSSTVNALGGLLALSLLLLLVLTVVVVVLAVMLKRARSGKMAAQDDVYYDGTVATSYLHGGAGAVSSRMSLLVASEADNSDTTEQLSMNRSCEMYHEVGKCFYVPNSRLRNDPNAIYGTVDEEGIYATADNEGNYEMDVSVNYWSPAQTTEAIFDQMSKGKYLEIPPSSVKKQRKLGEGEFGEVLKGEWTTPAIKTLPVALKTLKSSASEEERLKLLQEAAIMGQFIHPHIVRLYGVVTLSDPVMIVMELLGGDLRNQLLKVKRMRSLDVWKLQDQLLTFCREIAEAMEYLCKKGFIHRDLAARNILLTADTYMKCKLADFGLSHDMDEDYYYKPKGGRIPVKWTAPEAILYKKYTTKSDVWSYGMVMYEIWSLGHKPFEEFNIEEVIQAFNTGYCQPPPPGCPRGVYTIMVQCWHPDYHSRVSFTEVLQSLNYDQRALLKVDPRDKTGTPLSLTLGAPLEHGQELHKDLQNTYK